MKFIGIFSYCCKPDNFRLMDKEGKIWQCTNCKRMFFESKPDESDKEFLNRILVNALNNAVRMMF